MTEDPTNIPKPEDLPDAPEEFDLISEEDAELPQSLGPIGAPDAVAPATVIPITKIDVGEIDPAAVGNKLPKISELPTSWALILLGPLQLELQTNSTLPLLWERQTGEAVERVVAVSQRRLYHYPKIQDDTVHLCHAMPQVKAEEFTKWLGAQVFVRQSRDQYVECVIHSTTLSVDNAQYNAFVALPSTSKFHTRTTLHGIPLTIADYRPLTEVIRRARAVKDDPSSLISINELEA